MQLQPCHGAVAATWILVAGLIGLAGNVNSVGGAAWVLALGLVPPFLMMLHWSLAFPIRLSPPNQGGRTIDAQSIGSPVRGARRARRDLRGRVS